MSIIILCYNKSKNLAGSFHNCYGKKTAENILHSLPDDSSCDEILKELAFARMIDRGLNDSKNNKTISNEEMKQKIKQWQK